MLVTSISVKHQRLLSIALAGALLVAAVLGGALPAVADSTAQTLPFSQDWANTGLIVTSDDWSGVPGVVGYRGDGLTSTPGTDPQSILADGTLTPVDVNANNTNPNTFTTGGVTEFHIADPVVALQGSGTADAPFILLHLNTSGQSNITVAYNLRDIDGSADNSVQQVALQYRVGSTGNFTNVPAGYVADATTGPSLATLVTPVSVALPADANNQPVVQVRIITTDAGGSDEWVGIDDILVTGTAGDAAPEVSSTVPANGALDVAVDANLTVNFSEPVNVADGWFNISCATSGSHTAAVSGGPTAFTLDPAVDFAQGETCTVTVLAANVTDQDANDPPDAMAADYAWSFTTVAPPPPSPVLINELDSDTPGEDAAEFVELYDGGVGNTDLTGLALVFYNGSNDTAYAAFDLDGFSTDSQGFFVLGNSAGSPDLVFSNGTLQNGADAVALYHGNAANFPNSTPVRTLNLIDAIVYDTDDADDPGLLVLLNAGQPQVNELASGNSALASNQRCPDGSGGQRNTSTYLQNTPSAGAANNCGLALTIMEIQGAGHLSPYVGELVKDVAGVVTALAGNGFYMQSSAGDGNTATSDGLFVFTSAAPAVAVGDAVLVRGVVAEFRPGGSGGTTNLTTTELTSPAVQVTSTGNVLPAPTVLGSGGRVPPNVVIEDDAADSVETSGVFDPETDGIDFYESVEGMRVQVNDAVAVGPTNDFGEIAVVGDNGANAGPRTPRGGVVITPSDFNPERIILDDALRATPSVNVGDTFPGAILGVMDYSFGNFKLLVTEVPTPVSGGLTREAADDPGVNQFTVATFNVENLDPGDPADKVNRLAELIVENLRSPDILALEEVQDNTGPTNDGVVAADQTLAMLITAIQAAGGPTYEFRQIDPENNLDGGQPGGNIRVAFLFRTDRGVAFVDRPGGTSTDPVAVVAGPDGPQLSFSPGRVDPENDAWEDSRKPLAGEFTYQGRTLFVVVNHFNSKGGDQPLFGRFQPPQRISEVQRHQQAQVVNDFVDDILALDPNARVVVLGDLNDFQFSETVEILKGGVLFNLMDTLPVGDQYSYVFDGNSQVLDQILVSQALLDIMAEYDVLHVNAEFADQASDHDPQVAYFTPKLYGFSGFFPPVSPFPALNAVKAGQAVPLKFSLGGDQGLDILDAAQWALLPNCATDPVAGTDPVESPGGSGLTYDAATGEYTLVWKTDKSWAGTCRQLILTLDDGTRRRANFNFTK